MRLIAEMTVSRLHAVCTAGPPPTSHVSRLAKFVDTVARHRFRFIYNSDVGLLLLLQTAQFYNH